jgi:TolB-like protein/tetratricopeptide (TPR) repeat protein
LKEDSIDLAGQDARTALDGGLCVAVLPFKSTSGSADLAALAEELTDDIVAGMIRFSYLRIIAPDSTQHYAARAIDLRVAGKQPAARFVMKGTVRQEGSTVRISVKIVDTVSGTDRWSDRYQCAFSSDARFKLQDQLVPRIVSTVADAQGVLAKFVGESLRNRPPDELNPYEAVLRSFAYFKHLSKKEHLLARTALKLAVAKAPNAPGQSEAWAWLAIMYREEHAHGFNRLPDPLGRASKAAHRAIELNSSNHWAHLALASVLYYQRDIPAFRSVAKESIDSNPMDGSSMAYLASLLTVSGRWKLGCALMRKAQRLNPKHPGWYWIPAVGKAYADGDYSRALYFALMIKMPNLWISQFLLAAIYGQLGDKEEAQKAVKKLRKLKPTFAHKVREEFEKRYEQEFLDHLIEGLRKAGMEIPDRTRVERPTPGRRAVR